MPVFNILLAQDVSMYGSLNVEAETWQEAVARLEQEDWDISCTDPSEGAEERVVHVENEAGETLAEDLHYHCCMYHYSTIVHRLRALRDLPGRVPCTVMDKALEALIEELETEIRSSIFDKAGSAQ